ncbi:protein NETWORKED 3C-like [Zingiber officinale]|uniref:protein NETWORKED 3C-like n=1 Tax=Zingiber officinale TaxID=94328 RepID=UPI001C4AEA3C|nr:protein NETWORKED 3C-like [Zingiber officinale]XP_042409273.1 protein NETWORKED 3C-like [Zingiber officinale]
MTVQTGQSYSWWFASQDRRQNSAQSSWLSMTLSELEEKTRQMLNLVEEDADSFAKRAEMYYKKRPQLVNMIEDFYRTHRSLAEQYDQLKSGSGVRRSISVVPSYFNRSLSQSMSSSETDELTKSLSDSFDSEDSEIDDPEEEIVAETKLRVMPDEESNGYSVKLKQELERLKEENAKLKVEIAGKNEEKREVIRQLALSMDILKEENVTLRKCIKDHQEERKGGFFELKKLTKGMLSGKLFHGKSKNQTTVVAL